MKDTYSATLPDAVTPGLVSKSGNILEDNAVMLVCPVNCLGIMGAGLAKQFKVRFPVASSEYIDAAKAGYVSPGGVLVCSALGSEPFATGDNALYMIAFAATKDHWLNPSELEWVESIIDLLVAIVNDGIPSIAVPALGCGLGGLPYNLVKAMLNKAATKTPDTQWRVYPPNPQERFYVPR